MPHRSRSLCALAALPLLVTSMLVGCSSVPEGGERRMQQVADTFQAELDAISSELEASRARIESRAGQVRDAELIEVLRVRLDRTEQLVERIRRDVETARAEVDATRLALAQDDFVLAMDRSSDLFLWAEFVERD